MFPQLTAIFKNNFMSLILTLQIHKDKMESLNTTNTETNTIRGNRK